MYICLCVLWEPLICAKTFGQHLHVCDQQVGNVWWPAIGKCIRKTMYISNICSTISVCHTNYNNNYAANRDLLTLCHIRLWNIIFKTTNMTIYCKTDGNSEQATIVNKMRLWSQLPTGYQLTTKRTNQIVKLCCSRWTFCIICCCGMCIIWTTSTEGFLLFFNHILHCKNIGNLYFAA